MGQYTVKCAFWLLRCKMGEGVALHVMCHDTELGGTEPSGLGQSEKRGIVWIPQLPRLPRRKVLNFATVELNSPR